MFGLLTLGQRSLLKIAGERIADLLFPRSVTAPPAKPIAPASSIDDRRPRSASPGSAIHWIDRESFRSIAVGHPANDDRRWQMTTGTAGRGFGLAGDSKSRRQAVPTSIDRSDPVPGVSGEVRRGPAHTVGPVIIGGPVGPDASAFDDAQRFSETAKRWPAVRTRKSTGVALKGIADEPGRVIRLPRRAPRPAAEPRKGNSK
jgi:hypothetical protein